MKPLPSADTAGGENEVATEGRTEFFDLATDSAELRDLAHTDEKRVTALRDALADRAADLASKGAIAGGENVISEMDETRLRALGYVERRGP